MNQCSQSLVLHTAAVSIAAAARQGSARRSTTAATAAAEVGHVAQDWAVEELQHRLLLIDAVALLAWTGNCR
jgi:hypothetical protein